MHRFYNIAHALGIILKWFSVVFLVPMGLALWHGTDLLPFVVPLAAAVALGFVLQLAFPRQQLNRRDGFLLVVAVWFGISTIGALPYWLAGVGSIGEPVNALFESISGFSCTGSTVMNDISLEVHSRAIMMWRQLTQWLGGMGILALAVAVLPRLSIGGAEFLDDEAPGPRMEKLTPHIAATARRLWLLYTGATIVLVGLFLALHYGGVAPKMTPYQAVAHAFTTLPSGGFSPQARSVEAFGPAVQWLIIPFMFIAAMNFTLLWRALSERPGVLAEDTEFKAYGWVFLSSGGLVAVLLMNGGQYGGLEANLRQGFFQVATILTTTGYASTDFIQWSGQASLVLLLLMFVSGCVGSTSGGLKMMRWVVGAKVLARELFHRVHPSAVRPLRLSGRVLKDHVIQGALFLIVAYFGVFGMSCVVVGIDTAIAAQTSPNFPDLGALELVSAVAVALGNIGPGFGAFGPMENFEFLPVFSKFWLCLIMVAGRLEIMTMLVLLAPTYWRN
jgi:trk system potassium uptake protein TrkH